MVSFARMIAAEPQSTKSNLEKRLGEIYDFLNSDTFPYFKIIFFSAVILSCFSAYLFISNGFHIAHFDSKGHLLVPRRIIDSLRPGWKQIGAFWLPLPHLLYLPFVQNDFLYFSGTAATPISMVCFIGTVLLLFKVIDKIFDPFAAFCGSALYLTNPNMLYLQTTPLTENISMLCMLAVVYSFIRFARSKRRKYLLGTSVFSALGVLSRYENWFVFAALGILLLIISIKDRRGFKNFVIDSAILLALNIPAMALTFWINWYTTGHAYTDHSFKHTDFQPARGSFFMAFFVIMYTVANLISYEWTIFALVAAGFIFRKYFRDSGWVASLVLLAPFLLYLYEYRDNHPTRFRYGLPFVPVFCYFLSYWAGRTRLITFLFLVFVAHIAWTSPFARFDSSGLLMESLRDAENLSIQSDLLWYLRKHDDGKLILGAMGEIAPTLYDLKLPVKRYVHEGVKPWWNDANQHPEKVVGWVFLNQDDILWKRFHGDPEFHRHFALIGRSGFLELYQYTPNEEFNMKSHKPHATRDKFPIGSIPGV